MSGIFWGSRGFQANRTLYVPSRHMTSQAEPSRNALDLFQWPYGLAFSTKPLAGGSEPRPSVLSCPDTLRVVGTGKDTCPRGATYPATCPSWLLTRARVIGGPRGPGPCWNHTLHPLGFCWMVEAQEGGLTQTQHAACRESTHLDSAGRDKATPATTQACFPSAPKSHPCLYSWCPYKAYLACLSLQWSPEMDSMAQVRKGKITGR